MIPFDRERAIKVTADAIAYDATHKLQLPPTYEDADLARYIVDCLSALPPAVDEGMVERMASWLAIRDEYNPNAHDVAEWGAIRDDYRAAARAALEAALTPEPSEEP